MGATNAEARERVSRRQAVRSRRLTAGSITGSVRRFWRLAWDVNLTGMSAMLAYNMLLGIIPVALLGLFIAGQVLSSMEVQQSVLNDLRQVFPGTAEHTLNSLLSQIRHSTTSIGVLALIAALWLGSSFWGALDTAFTRIYGCQPRRWLEQKRFGLMMLGVVLLFMVATVAVPTVQSILDAGATHLPFDLARVTDVVYAISLGISVVVVLSLAIGLAIGVVDYAFPAYLTNISTLAQFGTTIVFILILLIWFYLLALIILGGAVVNALVLSDREGAC